MENKINYDVDIDPSRLLWNLKQVVDEFQDIDRKIRHIEKFIKNYVPTVYDDEIYEVTDTITEGQQILLDRYNKRKIELRSELEKISNILNRLLSD